MISYDAVNRDDISLCLFFNMNMGRLFLANKMPPSEREQVNEIIRGLNYCRIDGAVKMLEDLGYTFSRSSVYRYAKHLERDDQAQLAGPTGCVVVIVNRSTGYTATVLSTASALQLEAAIKAVGPAS